MLLSMTGFGEAHRQQRGLAVAVEVRTINSRFFKFTARTSEGYSSLEPEIEGAVRRTVRRGTVQVNLRVDRAPTPEDFKINADVLSRYRLQLQGLKQQWDLPGEVPLETLLALPGVVEDGQCAGFDASADWPVIADALEAALAHLGQMRIEEGRAMAADLRANCRAIAASLDQIESRAPLVIEAYRARLEERMRKALAEFEVSLDAGDLLKEVGLFADRADISEEIVRLRSHLEQFDASMDLPESSGRKLEFLTQEMFREANTIGSKASDVEITRHVIEMKAATERVREMIQNIE